MRLILRLLFVLALPVLACGPLAAAPTATPTLPPPAATIAASLTAEQPVIQCTPPPCADGELVCSGGDCPGGCGTICLAHTATPAAPAAPPAPPAAFDPANYQWQPVAQGFVQPLLVTHAGDGSGRIFVVEQTGLIWVVESDRTTLSEPFLDFSLQLPDKLFEGGYSEQGLLGLAFPPDYENNGFFFINYTDRAGDTVLSRFSVDVNDPNRAGDSSEEVLLTFDQPFANHNGGHLAFGPDGYLYIGLGDGGSGGDPQGNGQNLGVLLGKILRLDVDSGAPYAIPADNPFVATEGARHEIWAYGLRNPWRFSFDRATGDLFIGDVGQNAYEEVSFQPGDSAGGENYGWNYMEGLHEFEPGPPPADAVAPIAEYAQTQGGCAVTGGYVYRGPALPEAAGVYFYGDYCSGLLWTLTRDAGGAWQNALAFDTDFSISSFGEDEAGELYLVDLSGGIYRLARQ